MANLGLKESLIVVTSAKGVGKSTLAGTYLPPSLVDRVFYHDGEGSSNNLVSKLAKQNLAFGYRNNLDDRWTKGILPGNKDLLNRIASGQLPWVNTKERDSLIDYWYYIREDINENLTPGKFSVYVHDPVERLESSMAAWVSAHKNETGWKKMAYGEMWTKGFYPLYRALFSAIWQRGVDVIILTAHLGNPWTDEGPIPGKVRPKAKVELFKLAQLYVWLVNEPNNSTGAPAGIILKERLGTVGVTKEDTWDLQRRLPRRVPSFTWDNIQKYLDGSIKCDLANPAFGEVPTKEEQSMIDDALSDKQMQLMLLRARTTLAEVSGNVIPIEPSAEGEFDIGDVSPATMARKLYADGEGVPVEQIATTLKKPLPLVKRWVEDT